MPSQAGNRTGRRRSRWLVAGLWGISIVLIIAGFMIRAFGSLLHWPNLRLTGVVFIACGLAAGVIGWLGEKLFGDEPPSRA